MKFRTFSDAKTFVHLRNLKSKKEWNEYCNSGKKPNDIPVYPNEYYKGKGWISWGDWLGTDTIASQNRKFLPFNEARAYARSLNLSSVREWEEYSKSGNISNDIPKSPNKSYQGKGWISWGDWLGTDTIAVFNRKFRPFNEAREFARSLHLSGKDDWYKYYTNSKLSSEIPTNPSKSYKDKGWISWGDWLGTYTISYQNRKFRPFNEAREYARSLNLPGVKEWEEHCSSGKKPNDIPSSPDKSYKDKGWISWGDWLGTGTLRSQETGWSIEKVKELLRSMIDSRIIYDWSEARLYKFLLTKGVLNLKSENKHSNFFKNLIDAVRTEEGKKL